MASDFSVSALALGSVTDGICTDTYTEGAAYAFVGPHHISALNEALDELQATGRYPDGYAERFAKRLLGVVDPS